VENHRGSGSLGDKALLLKGRRTTLLELKIMAGHAGAMALYLDKDASDDTIWSMPIHHPYWRGEPGRLILVMISAA
jgi:hypothetical protein